MLADITVVDRIYIITGYTDMRKAIDGLCAIIKQQMDEDQPDGRSLYLIFGGRCDRFKAILKEPDGLVMLCKRLTAAGRYRWPRNSSEVRNLTWKEFGYLMDGIDIEQPKAIKVR